MSFARHERAKSFETVQQTHPEQTQTKGQKASTLYACERHNHP
jgi:hypothetical protein